jgi:hypothetical protein
VTSRSGRFGNARALQARAIRELRKLAAESFRGEHKRRFVGLGVLCQEVTEREVWLAGKQPIATVRRRRELRGDSVSNADDEAAYASLRSAEICSVQQLGATAVSEVLESIEDGLQDASRTPLLVACCNDPAHVLKEQRSRLQLLDDPAVLIDKTSSLIKD